MNNNRYKFLLSALLMLVLPASFAMAQYKVQVDKPEIVAVKSPDFKNLMAKKKFKPSEWLEVEVKFKVEVSSKAKKKVKFLDKVLIKWFIAAKTPENGKGMILLEKEVMHVNVPVGKEIYASVYLSPNSVLRLTGNDRVSKAVFEEVGGEIRVNGMEAHKNSGFFSMNKQSKWWTNANLSRYDKIPLLNKNETPFKIMWYGRYAEIENKR